MMKRLVDGSFGATNDTHEALVLLLKGIAHEVQTNEFARVMLDDPSGLERLAAAMDFQDILQRASAFYAPLVERVVEAQARGEIIEGDPREILYSLGLIKVLVLNRDKMPLELYESMMMFVPEVLANGLTCSTRQTARSLGAAERTGEGTLSEPPKRPERRTR